MESLYDITTDDLLIMVLHTKTVLPDAYIIKNQFCSQGYNLDS